MSNTIRFTCLFALVFWALSAETFAQNKMSRNKLLDVALEKQAVSSVKSVEIGFPPGQKGPRHKHPCPVVGYVISGSIIYQVEGEDKQILEAGESFYEPADTPIAHFDNNSDTKPVRFVVFYLTNGDEELIQVLPDSSEH